VTPDGAVYVVAGWALIRLNQAGNQVWSTLIGRVDNGSIAVEVDRGSANQVFVATGLPQALRAYRTADGTLAWERPLDSPAAGGIALHALSGRVLFGCEDGQVAAYSRDGAVGFLAAPGATVRQAPLVGPDGLIYAVSQTGVISGYAAAGHLTWQRFFPTQLVGQVALAGPGRLVARTATGLALSIVGSGAQGYSSAVGATLPAAAVGPAGEAYYLASDGVLVRVSNGGVMTRYADPGCPSPTHAALLVYGCGSLLACVNNKATALGPDGAIRWQVDLPAPVTQIAAPADGVVLVAAGSHVVRLTSPPQGQAPLCQPHLTLPAPGGDSGWHRSSPKAAVGGRPAYGWPLGLRTWIEREAPGGPVATEVDPDGTGLEITGEGVTRVRIAYQLGSAPIALGGWHEVKIDRTPPQATLVSPRAGEPLRIGQVVRPQVTCADHESGVAEVLIWVDGSAVEGSFTVRPGMRALRVEVRDNAGNITALNLSLTLHDTSSALCLNPVITGSAATVPAWSRWVTVALRVALESLQAGEPQEVRMAGVAGQLAARLPTVKGAASRSYLFRFPRHEITAALATLAAGQAPGRLHQLQPIVSWRCGANEHAATAAVLYRP
jgi:outer membrane protein assembly factor BamB